MRAAGDAGARRAGREAGFTLMEILIAMTVLMIGLLPMMAVFKTALNNLNRAIEDTYSASIAQSVFDSIRLGLKDMKVEHDAGTAGEWKFFILDHDGVKDLEEDRRGNLLRDISNPGVRAQLLNRDYAILLPSRALDTESPSGGQGGTNVGKAFLYPKKSRGDTAARKAAEYVDGEIKGEDGKTHKTRKIKVEAVYQLGAKLKSGLDEAGNPITDEARKRIEQNDPYVQYSFAFTIRKAKAPDPAAPVLNLRQQNVLDGLYEVVVRVYRNFSDNPTSKRNETVGGPGREYITYVAE